MDDVRVSEGGPVDIGLEEERFGIRLMNLVTQIAVNGKIESLLTMNTLSVNLDGEGLVT